MRAIRVDRFGGLEVLQVAEVSIPEPGPGEVLVRAAASDVLHLDTMIRSGAGKDFFPIRPPYIPGNGIAGLVISAGADVQPAIVGQAVVTHTGGMGGCGGYAEQVWSLPQMSWKCRAGPTFSTPWQFCTTAPPPCGSSHGLASRSANQSANARDRKCFRGRRSARPGQAGSGRESRRERHRRLQHPEMNEPGPRSDWREAARGSP